MTEKESKNQRLKIRLLTEQDFPLMLRWLSDPRVLQFYEGRDFVASPGYIADHFGEPFEDGGWRVIMERDGVPVGYGQIYKVAGSAYEEYSYPDCGGIVYATDQFIGDPSCWNCGIGTLYMDRVCEFLRCECHADAVILDPHKSNPRAVRCYEKAGFSIIGELPGHELFEGKYEDCWLMEKRLTEQDIS